MSEKPWLNHYTEGCPSEIPPLSEKNLPEFLRKSVEGNEKKIAFTQCNWNGMNGSLRFNEVDRLSDAFAVYLREVVGLNEGDRVAVQLPNCLSYPVAVFGILKAGCVLVNMNPLYTASEMKHQLIDSGARAIVIIDMFADRLTSILAQTPLEKVITAKVGEFFPTVIAGIVWFVQKYWNKVLPPIEVAHTRFRQALDEGLGIMKDKDAKALTDSYLESIDLESLAALQYTGGTTGVAKGAMLSHGNILSNVYQCWTFTNGRIKEGQETILTALPLYHIFAFTVAFLLFFKSGNRNILVPNPRPPSNLKRAFENYRITWLPGVNTLFNALLNERWFVDSPPKHLAGSVAGGMSLHKSVADKWTEIVKSPIYEGYGLSETSPVLSLNPVGGVVKIGSIGVPYPSTELRCVDDNGEPLPTGEPGEITARGPQVMSGYWQRPEETDQAIRNGWFHTGDVAVMDEDGYFQIVDRKKDMVIVSGFNVYPNEVEEVIAKHPGVLEAGVIGVPNESTGEEVRAYVVRSDMNLGSDEIIRHCRDHLAKYKIPRLVEFRDELPKSLIGKILRKDLRAEVLGENKPEKNAESTVA